MRTLTHTLEKRSKHEPGQQVEVEIEEEEKAESEGKLTKSNGKAGAESRDDIPRFWGARCRLHREVADSSPSRDHRGCPPWRQKSSYQTNLHLQDARKAPCMLCELNSARVCEKLRKEERQRERSPIFHPSLFSHSLHQYSHHRRIEIYRLSNLDTPFAESIIPGQMWNTLNRPYNQYPSISHHRAFYFPSKLRPPEQHQGNLT